MAMNIRSKLALFLVSSQAMVPGLEIASRHAAFTVTLATWIAVSLVLGAATLTMLRSFMHWADAIGNVAPRPIMTWYEAASRESWRFIVMPMVVAACLGTSHALDAVRPQTLYDLTGIGELLFYLFATTEAIRRGVDDLSVPESLAG